MSNTSHPAQFTEEEIATITAHGIPVRQRPWNFFRRDYARIGNVTVRVSVTIDRYSNGDINVRNWTDTWLDDSPCREKIGGTVRREIFLTVEDALAWLGSFPLRPEDAEVFSTAFAKEPRPGSQDRQPTR